MALETGTYISDLVETNPVAADGLSQADDHMRLIKAVLKNTFPNVAGAVTPTHTVLNGLPGRVTALEARVDDVFQDSAAIPVGVITLWYGTAATVPTNWRICDGVGGTPDLRGYYVKGCGQDADLGAYGGNANPTSSASGSHNHTGWTGFGGGHYHHFDVASAPANATTVVESGGPVSVASSGHQHNVAGDTWGVDNHQHSIPVDGNHNHTVAVDPAHKKIYYIMKIA